MKNCKNCNTEVHSNYCPNCGQPAKLRRIDGKYMRQEIGNVLNLDKGFFFTIRELIIRPGTTVRNYLNNERNRLVKPIIFILVTSLIYSFVNNFFHFEEQYIHYKEQKMSTVGLMVQWMQNNYGYANILMGFFIAFFIKLLFRKYQYNFYEILILLCYVMGIAMLVLALFVLFQVATNINLLQVASVLILVYIMWAIADFFDRTKVMSYVKSFFSYILGMVLFFVLVIALGNLIDVIIK